MTETEEAKEDWDNDRDGGREWVEDNDRDGVRTTGTRAEMEEAGRGSHGEPGRQDGGVVVVGVWGVEKGGGRRRRGEGMHIKGIRNGKWDMTRHQVTLALSAGRQQLQKPLASNVVVLPNRSGATDQNQYA